MIKKVSLLPLAILVCSATLFHSVDTIHEQNAPIGSIKINLQDEGTIEKRITIIVGDEEPTVAPTTPEPAPLASKAGRGQVNDRPNIEELTRTRVDETTKVVFVDSSSASGLLFGEVGSKKGQQSSPASSNVSMSSQEPADSATTKSKELNSAGSPSNYSVYLISREKSHVAILLDIEDIDFEPIINCEYQELRFSIVGEISKKILDRRNATDQSAGESDDGTLNGGDSDGLEDESAERGSGMAGAREPVASSLPVSEAMALLMNAPLNVTIMDESEEGNDFRLIDTTIDYLFDETCRDVSTLVGDNNNNNREMTPSVGHNKQDRLETANKRTPNNRNKHRHHHHQHHHHHHHNHQYYEHNNNNNNNNNNQENKNSRHNHRLQQTSRRQHQARNRGSNHYKHGGQGEQRTRKRPDEASCDRDSHLFRELMASKLNEHLEWDDFKIVCGKTSQLVIPMRSLKLSMFSDEFAPNGRFSIRYQFIGDPSQLPGLEAGKYFCRNRRVIDVSLKCDGYDDCGDASDESVKICGYPTGRNGNSNSNEAQSSPRTSSSHHHHEHHRRHLKESRPGQDDHLDEHSPHSSATGSSHRRRLTYFNGDLLHCCQSSDWHNIVPQERTSQAMNLQSLIGESMKLFSGPLFAPTSSERQPPKRPKRRFKRIVGGGEAQRGSWPGQVSLQYELIEPLCHFCAGTLVHPQYVLTAGHCITKDGLARGIKVALGAHDLRQLAGGQIQVRYVDDAQIYPGVDVKHLSFDWENDMNNDIALLRLNAPVLLTAQVAPACLPPFNTPLAMNTTCRSIGWGQTHGSGSSNLLKHLSLKVVDSSVCSRELVDKDRDGPQTAPSGNRRDKGQRSSAFRSAPRRSPTTAMADFESIDAYSNQTMICMNNDLGHGICQGDSGGPLYCDRTTPAGDHCTEIYGVASFIIQYATVGAMCAVENLPGIFGEVSSKTEWISSTIKMFEQSYRLKYTT